MWCLKLNNILKYISIFVAIVLILSASYFALLFFTNILDDKGCECNSVESCVAFYAYEVLNHYFNKSDFDENSYSNILNENSVPSVFLDYDKFSVIFFKDGDILGIGLAENGTGIFPNAKESVLEAVEDSELKQQDLGSLSMVFSLLYNKSNFLYSNSDYIQNHSELGIHSLEINYGSKSACYPGCYPIFKDYDSDEFLSNLLGQAGIEEDFDEEEVDFFRYDTYSFVRLSNGDVVDWYRCSPLLEVEYITNDMILNRLELAGECYLANIDPQTELVQYEYYPVLNVYSGNNNHLRQLASLWIMCKLYNFTKDERYLPVINRTLDYYLSFKIDEKDFSHIYVGGDDIANNGFIILALCEYDKYPDSDILIKRLARGILVQQSDNGSYALSFSYNNIDGMEYYPGEAMFGLMKCYQKTENISYLESVENGFNYYRDYWRDYQNNPMIPWHSQAYTILYEVTGDKNYADFVFEMNDWLINNYQILENPDFKDKLGGFYNNPGASTSVYLEGVNDAYMLACLLNDTHHMDLYKESISSGVCFLLQTQYTKDNVFYLENTDQALGGFRSSLIDGKVRVDNIQHAVNALIKTYENKIFI